MIDLPGIRKADGLDDEAAAALDEVLDVADRVQARNAELSRYYDGSYQVPEIGVKPAIEGLRLDETCDWPRKAVTAVSERARFDRFVFGDSGGDDGALERVVRRSRVATSYGRYVASELTHGCMFATVGRSEADGLAYVRFHSAETAWAVWDDAAGRVGAGVCVADRRRTEWSPNDRVAVAVNLHMPDRVVALTRRGAAEWSAESMPHPMGRPMMEAFAFRATGTRPFGESRITRAVRTIACDVVRTLRDMAVSGAFYAAPQKFLMGVTDQQFDALKADKWSAYIGSMLITTANEQGGTPTIGQLSGSTPQPYVELLQTYAKLFAAATGVPLNSLGVVQDNPSSAEAIAAQREDVVIAAQDLIDGDAESLRTIALMALAVERGVAPDGLGEAERSVMAHFRSPANPSIVSQADAMTKLMGPMPWLAESDVALEEVGFSDEQVKRLRSDRAKAKSRAIVDAATKAAGLDLGGSR